MTRLLALSVLAFAMGVLLPTSAAAQGTNTGTIAVSANVVTSCQITATALDFQNYFGARKTAESTLTVDCNTASVGYSVTLDDGGYWSGTTRQMAPVVPGPSRLAYELYTDNTYGTEWRGVTAVAGTTSAVSPSTDGSLQVWGVIPANQLLTATGGYGDTVRMTVTF